MVARVLLTERPSGSATRSSSECRRLGPDWRVLRHYTPPSTSTVVPLLHIVPSKLDIDRLIPMTPALMRRGTRQSGGRYGDDVFLCALPSAPCGEKSKSSSPLDGRQPVGRIKLPVNVLQVLVDGAKRDP